MPKSCAECLFWYLCKVPNKENAFLLYNHDKRDEDCPLVEIVTCKDCKHWHDDGIMTTCDKNIGNGFPRDYFCAYGERKE